MKSKKFLIFISMLLLTLIGLGGYFGYKYYLNSKKYTFDVEDSQKQINYSLDTKRLLDKKPFIDKLPFSSEDFEIYYSTVKDEVRIIMKNKGLTFNEAKAANESMVNNFLLSIGVDPNIQKVTWFLEQ